ncbi:MAG: type II toxin-antitoxin system HicA family toxin [Acidimicrobiaceae bacterium]|nr:type II toxin-antitoxin system HicA family toxin [Acidimicrobiaceae bacterium]
MDKRTLIKRIREIAKKDGFELTFVREGGNHEIWSIRGHRLVIPRHREINEYTAQGILNMVKEVTRDEQ